jgi:hypothetical protein
VYGAKAPRGWLFVAFLGVWLYLVSQVLRVYEETVAPWAGLSRADLLSALAITAGLGSLLFFAGVVSALWRANLAAGLSGAGVRGLVLGASGVGVLLVFEAVLLLAYFDVGDEFVSTLLRPAVRTIGDILGTALSFAGLASLAVGLAQAVRLFRGPAPEVGASTRPSEPPT